VKKTPVPFFNARERRLLAQLRTPLMVQRHLNQLPYNNEPGGRATLRSFRGVVRHGCAHCLEAALFSAVALEQHGYPPLVLSFESIDELDHVIFVYRHGGRWGSVARSRDPGLHGRRPVFATPRALAWSYVEPYVDLTGRIKASFVTANRFNANQVKVVTERGVVYLMGLVNKKEADDATDIARRTPGVQKVVRVFEYPS